MNRKFACVTKNFKSDNNLDIKFLFSFLNAIESKPQIKTQISNFYNVIINVWNKKKNSFSTRLSGRLVIKKGIIKKRLNLIIE